MMSCCRTILNVATVLLAGMPAVLLAEERGTDRSDGRDPLQRVERPSEGGPHKPDRVLVRVDGEAVREGDLELLMISRQIPEKLWLSVRKRFLEQLIDRRLMRSYLAERKAEPDPLELNAQVERIYKLIRKQGDDPQVILSQLGYTEETLRGELALPLAWETHLRRIVTPKRLRDYFQQHRRQFDGTERRARQILIKISNPDNAANIEAAKEKLRSIRRQIVDGMLTFAEAAQKHSDAPSAKKGGDVGFFSYRGPMPEAFTRAVFELGIGETSQPFVTPFGVHLVKVTDEKPGQLSLEDARMQVFAQLGEELWNQTVRDLRSKVKIEWILTDTPDP